MKAYTIVKTEYNGAYGTVDSQNNIVTFLDEEKAKDAKRRYENNREYAKPTYFSISETPIEE